MGPGQRSLFLRCSFSNVQGRPHGPLAVRMNVRPGDEGRRMKDDGPSRSALGRGDVMERTGGGFANVHV